MHAILTLLAIAAFIITAVTTLSAVVVAVRMRETPLAAVGVLLGIVFLVVALGVRVPLVTLAAALIVGLIARSIGLRAGRARPRGVGEATRLSAAHVALLAGTFLFMIPFVWLISTSLKPDDEQSAFPPIWIPSQQITDPSLIRPDGKPAGISDYRPAAAPKTAPAVRVAEVSDLPTGDIKVQVLAPAADAGRTFTATHDELTKVRKVSPRWENYAEALAFLPPETMHGLVYLRNTLILTLLSAIGTIISSSLVAYAFSRLNWPGRELWFGVLLATMMIPSAVTMMPQFLIFRSLGWYDTLTPLWAPAFLGSAFNVFLLRQFFLSIPTELEDAAKIDGCGPFGIYWRVMLPLVKPALAAIGILSILGSWNNFQGPLIYISSPEKMPMAYALQQYQTAHSSEPGLLMAASTLVVLPIIVLFFFTQRYFIEGVSLTGLAGR
jgi:multiple sugar transport system permease protein